MTTCVGYRIVCPDGKVRSYPYHNRGDAEFDAELYTAFRHNMWPDDKFNECPQGVHTVKECIFEHP